MLENHNIINPGLAGGIPVKRPLTLEMAEIVEDRAFRKMEAADVAQKHGVSRSTVSRIMNRSDVRTLMMSKLEKYGMTIDEMAKKTVALTKATKKTKGVKGSQPDNSVQLGAMRIIHEIAGTAAPKEHDVRHSMDTLSNDDLNEQVTESVENLENVQ